MKTINPSSAPVKEVFDLLLGGIGPRPIALVSTISENGIVNLSPFSFFNCFGSNPPIIAFSPSRRLRDASVKDTFNNLRAVGECVVQSVTYAMVQQVSLASTEYPPEVDEFAKSGLTPVPSVMVKPPRVAQSPFQMECRVQQIIELGGKNASGNLIICEVLLLHVAEDIMENGTISPKRIDLVARMGGDFYCRANGEAIFSVKKPVATRGVGYDQIPLFIRESRVLSANNLGQLGNIEKIPTDAEVQGFASDFTVVESTTEAFYRHMQLGEYRSMLAVALSLEKNSHASTKELFELTAKRALDFDQQEFAWKTLLLSKQFHSRNS